MKELQDQTNAARTTVNRLLDKLDSREPVDVAAVTEQLQQYNDAVEIHEKAIPLTPDKLSTNHEIAFSEAGEREQCNRIMDWWSHLDRCDAIAEAVVERERERRIRSDVPMLSPVDFGHLLEDPMTEFIEETINQEAFQAVNAEPALNAAIEKMQSRAAARVSELWNADE